MFRTALATGNLNYEGSWNFTNEYLYLENIVQTSVKYWFCHK